MSELSKTFSISIPQRKKFFVSSKLKSIIKILTPIDFIFDALEKDFSTVPLEHTNIEIEKEFVKLLVLEMSLSLFQVEEYFNNFIKVKEEEIDKILDKGTSLEEKMVFFLK